MRTYSRACKNKKTESKGEEVFFIEKAFKSSIEIPSSTDKGNRKAPRNVKDRPNEDINSNKRKQQEPANKLTNKKTKKTNEREPVQKAKKTNTRSSVKEQSVNKDTEKKTVVNTKTLPVEAAILPLMDVSCLEKVNSWLENCVEDDADSLHSSIELWRGEDITGSGRGKSLFPEEFYKNLRSQYVKDKEPNGKENMNDEKEAFFSKLQMRLQHTPVRKTSGQKSSTATIEATESEGLTYSYEQSDPQTFSELFKTDTWTKSHSDSKVIEMEMYSGTHPNESQIEAQTKSTTQTGTTQYETGTQPSTQYSTRASLTQNKLVSKTATSRETTTSKKTPDKVTGFKPPTRQKKSSAKERINHISQPKTSTRLYEEDSLWIEEPLPAVSTIQFETDKQNPQLQEKNQSKKVKAADKVGGVINEDRQSLEPKTSTKLFTTRLSGLDELSPGLSAIAGKTKDDTAKGLLFQEKTPEMPIEMDVFKPPRRVGAKGKRTPYAGPKTSTRLFHTDTVDIEDAFPALSAITNGEENKDVISPKKYSAPVTTSTPNDKHLSGRNLQFEMDISSVNQDSGDGSVGLHFEPSTREVNSEEIVALSETHISPLQCQNSFRRKCSKTLRYSTSLGVAETLVKTRPRVLASTDRKRCLSFEQLQKVVVCPLITMKHSKVIPSHGNCHLKFMNPSNNCTDQGGVPDDILCTL